MKKRAFTLAETLIVIGIIGVVAALTLPNLNHATGDKEKITKVKKIYSALNEAFDRAQAIYGDTDTWFLNDSDAVSQTVKFGNRVTEFLKVSKNCSNGEDQGCFNNSINFFGKSIDSSDENYKFITNDKMSINFRITSSQCEYSDTNIRDICGYIHVDIEGPQKGSHKEGKDVFKFFIKKDRIVPIYPVGENPGCSQLYWCCNQNTGSSCTGWLLQNDNMDYLKVGNDGKCPDGKTILDGVNNTSCH